MPRRGRAPQPQPTATRHPHVICPCSRTPDAPPAPRAAPAACGMTTGRSRSASSASGAGPRATAPCAACPPATSASASPTAAVSKGAPRLVAYVVFLRGGGRAKGPAASRKWGAPSPPIPPPTPALPPPPPLSTDYACTNQASGGKWHIKYCECTGVAMTVGGPLLPCMGALRPQGRAVPLLPSCPNRPSPPPTPAAALPACRVHPGLALQEELGLEMLRLLSGALGPPETRRCEAALPSATGCPRAQDSSTHGTVPVDPSPGHGPSGPCRNPLHPATASAGLSSHPPLLLKQPRTIP